MDPRERSVWLAAERLLWRAPNPPLPRATSRAARRALGRSGPRRVRDAQRRLWAAAAEAEEGLESLLGAEPICPEEQAAASIAAADTAALLRALARVYGLELEPRPWRPVLGGAGAPAAPPRPHWTRGPLERPREARPEALAPLLTRLFGLTSFRPGQAEAAAQVLNGEDTVLILPTGAGKSLVFHLAGLLLPGTCLVIEPTLSLIHDQARRLKKAGIRRVLALTGEADSVARRKKELAALSAGEALFCFVAPERLQTDSFRAALKRLAGGAGIAAIVVDEAHCVAEWGHDFRPAYLTACAAARRIAAKGGKRPPVLAVTATLPEEALPELRQALGLGDAALLAPGGLRPPRPELELRVRECRSEDKPRELERLLAGRAASGVVFCPHVMGEFGVREVARRLRDGGRAVDLYHGRPPEDRGKEEWERERRQAAKRFQEDRARLLVATKAFGIGIDKPNIRYTVHFGLPGGLEAFEQEAGRAGRDGLPAENWVLLSIDDARRARRWLDPATPLARVRSELESLARGKADDIARALRLHLNSFPGVERELEDVRQVLVRLGEWRQPGTKLLSLEFQPKARVEKALCRLIGLGIVSDYTVVWPKLDYVLRLPGASAGTPAAGLARCAQAWGCPPPDIDPALPEPLGAAKALIEAAYRTIETRRRASLGKLLERCRGTLVDNSTDAGKTGLFWRVLSTLRRARRPW